MSNPQEENDEEYIPEKPRPSPVKPEFSFIKTEISKNPIKFLFGSPILLVALILIIIGFVYAIIDLIGIVNFLYDYFTK